MKHPLKLYSKTGDRGESGLADGKRLSKADEVFEVLGTLDELNSLLGFAVAEIRRLTDTRDVGVSHSEANAEESSVTEEETAILSPRSFADVQDDLPKELMRIQERLLVIGAVVAGSEKVQLEEAEVAFLEERIDWHQVNTREDWYKHFLLPGGVELAARVDVARSVCRRLERRLVAFQAKSKVKSQKSKLIGEYVNRLSDYLFALRCYVNSVAGYEEREFRGSE